MRSQYTPVTSHFQTFIHVTALAHVLPDTATATATATPHESQARSQAQEDSRGERSPRARPSRKCMPPYPRSSEDRVSCHAAHSTYMRHCRGTRARGAHWRSADDAGAEGRQKLHLRHLHQLQWPLASLLRQKDWHCSLGTSFGREETHVRGTGEVDVTPPPPPPALGVLVAPPPADANLRGAAASGGAPALACDACACSCGGASRGASCEACACS